MALFRGAGAAAAAGIWTIQAGIFPENTASMRLHQGCGFRIVGVRERIGQHHGRWRRHRAPRTAESDAVTVVGPPRRRFKVIQDKRTV